jgi:catechol 2,3-dioxygenase-like lactoylglutathione lyase family enzyme
MAATQDLDFVGVPSQNA